MKYKVKLSDVCTIKYGKDHKVLRDGLYPVYGTGGIMRYVNEFIYDKASVLIPRKGTLSNIFYVEEPFWTIDTLFYTQIDKSKILPKYLYYYLKRFNFDEMNVGTAVPSLTTALLNELELNIPSLNKQNKILDLLVPFDKKIETNNAIIANLEAQAQAIFKSWFVDFEPFQDGDFVESELGMIPEGWEVKKIEEVTESLLGGTPARKKEEFWCGDIPWINSGELNKIRIIEPTEYITKKGLENSSTKLLPKKTTVIAITGATLGQVSLLEIDTCANQSVIGILENENLPYEYIYPFFLNNIDMIILNQTGSSQQHINNNDIKNTKMILPINKVMDAYEQIVSPIYKLVENYMFQNKVLSQTRDTLLPKLMSGEIRVGQDDIEEIENLL